MANCMWEKIIKNGWFEEVMHLYGKEFPWEVRSTLSSWLARDDSFMSFDRNEPSHHECIYAFVDALIHELSQQINGNRTQDAANLVYKQRLSKLFKKIKTQDRMHLFQVIRDTLAYEKQKVDELSGSVSTESRSSCSSTSQLENTFAQIKEEIDNALMCTQEKCSKIEIVPELNNRFTSLHYNMYMLHQQQQNIGNGNHFNADTQIWSAEEIQAERTRLNQDIRCTFNTMVEVLGTLISTHPCVLRLMETWHDEQRLVALGKPADKKLDSIEKWFKMMTNCFDILELQLPVFKTLCEKWNCPVECLSQIQESIDKVSLLRGALRDVSLVITQEPKQIVRTGPNIGPVRLQVLPFCTNMMITSVKAVFINHKTAKEYFGKNGNSHEKLPTNSGDLKFGKGGLKVTNSRIEYQTMTVSKVRKSTKRGEQFVVEERFWIYFRVVVNCQGRSIILHTTSLPISVTSHPVQEGKAWTHVLWYNAFPVKSRQQHFHVPDDIPWDWLIEAINLRFIDLGKGLSPDQKSYLKDRLFKGRDGCGIASTVKDKVSKNRFCGDTFVTGKVDPETSEDGTSFKNYSFGEWLFCCLKILSWAPKNGKLAKYGVKHFWKDGKIEGFMPREKLEASLNGTRPGTFIIRFPENMPDCIGLYFYDYSANPGDKLRKQLLTIKDFNIKALQDRILDNEAATYLYPNHEKGKAFTRMCKIDTSIVNGYFTVSLREEFPSSLLQSLKHSHIDQNITSPSSSHSVHSNYSQRFNAFSPTGSLQSDHSSSTGSFSNYSPESSTNNLSLLDDFSVYSSPLDGIDPRVLLYDNDMDI